jgi:hypothetical protein
MPQRFQFIAEKFQPHRPGARQRVNVQDAAAQGHLALLRHLRFRLITLFLEPFHQVQRLNPVAAMQRAHPRLRFRRGKGALQQRRHARHHHSSVHIFDRGFFR